MNERERAGVPPGRLPLGQSGRRSRPTRRPHVARVPARAYSRPAMGGRAGSRSGVLASLAAMLFFAFAVVKSDLMQIAMAAPATTICADMAPGTGMAAAPHAGHAKPGRAAGACLYCDTAAHPPLIADALLVPEPWTVAWVPALPTAPNGPRAPPQPRPKARAPPHFLIV